MHYMLDVAGHRAQVAADGIVDKAEQYDCRCTRVDMQLTLPLPADYNARKTTDLLRGNKFARPGPNPAIRLIDSGHYDTVYIGSRHSDRMARLYVKELEGEDGLRLEFQYGAELAADAWRKYCKRPATFAGEAIAAELEAMPAIKVLDPFRNQLRGLRSGRVRYKYKVVDEPKTRTEKWINNQVVPTLKRLLADHDAGDRTALMLVELLEDSGHFM